MKLLILTVLILSLFKLIFSGPVGSDHTADTKDQITDSKWQKVFKIFDKDEDGQLTAEELRAVMIVSGKNVTYDEAKGIISILGSNGYIKVTEFVEFMTVVSEELEESGDEEDKFGKAFDILDKDKDGLIGTSDLLKLMDSLKINLTDEEAKKMKEITDPDGDGKIKFDDFLKFLKFRGDEDSKSKE